MRKTYKVGTRTIYRLLERKGIKRSQYDQRKN
ncbi:hypothetical protein [Lysinibacillus sp. CTST325]